MRGLVRELNTVQLPSANHLPAPWPQLFTNISQLLYMASIKAVKKTKSSLTVLFLVTKQEHRGVAQLKAS